MVSDTAWPGYERVPGLVLQGYTVMARAIPRALPRPPTHLFPRAGVGGLAAAVAVMRRLARPAGDETTGPFPPSNDLLRRPRRPDDLSDPPLRDNRRSKRRRRQSRSA